MFNYDKLEDAIQKSGKTKTYLCNKLGRPKYYLRDVVRQKNTIPPEYQLILAEELGVTVEYLNDEINDYDLVKSVPDELFHIIMNATPQQREDILKYARFIIGNKL